MRKITHFSYYFKFLRILFLVVSVSRNPGYVQSAGGALRVGVIWACCVGQLVVCCVLWWHCCTLCCA